MLELGGGAAGAGQGPKCRHPPPPPRLWRERVQGKGSEWRSASRRRQLQTRSSHHGVMPNPPPPAGAAGPHLTNCGPGGSLSNGPAASRVFVGGTRGCWSEPGDSPGRSLDGGALSVARAPCRRSLALRCGRGEVGGGGACLISLDAWRLINTIVMLRRIPCRRAGGRSGHPRVPSDRPLCPPSGPGFEPEGLLRRPPVDPLVGGRTGVPTWGHVRRAGHTPLGSGRHARGLGVGGRAARTTD